MEKQIKRLRTWGYSVQTANEFAMHVSGAGISTYVNKDDEEAWDSLALLDPHIERSTQMLETLPETMQRHGKGPQAG